MRARTVFSAWMLVCAACASPPDAAPDPDSAGQGAHVIRGAFAPGQQPDGNTVVLEGKGGLIVFDTGRHPAHTQKILDYAAAKNEPIVAIFNSHWHLDHISGNPMLRAVFPKAAVYSNDAALTEALSGFLAQNADMARKMIAGNQVDAARLPDMKADLATIESGAKLHPTVSLEKSTTLTIAGRRIEAHAAKGASSGDIWMYDPTAKLVLTGDLITLPAPFLDTACPSAWSSALEDVLAQPFEHAVPGHGRIMSRADVALYRDAFNGLIACAKSTTDAGVCADQWAAAAAPLQDGAQTDGKAARDYARYYVEGPLRKGPKRADCPI